MSLQFYYVYVASCSVALLVSALLLLSCWRRFHDTGCLIAAVAVILWPSVGLIGHSLGRVSLSVAAGVFGLVYWRRRPSWGLLAIATTLLLWAAVDIVSEFLLSYFIRQVALGNRPWLPPYSRMVDGSIGWSEGELPVSYFMVNFAAVKDMLTGSLLFLLAVVMRFHWASALADAHTPLPEQERGLLHKMPGQDENTVEDAKTDADE